MTPTIVVMTKFARGWLHRKCAASIFILTLYLGIRRILSTLAEGDQMRIGLEVGRENGPLWLSLSGREGVKPFLKMELGVK
jgi:hypothetical protein